LRALVIEVGQVGTLQAGRRGRISRRNQLGDSVWIGFLLVEDRGDIRNRSAWPAASPAISSALGFAAGGEILSTENKAAFGRAAIMAFLTQD
jgi:hypothetical protein